MGPFRGSLSCVPFAPGARRGSPPFSEDIFFYNCVYGVGSLHGLAFLDTITFVHMLSSYDIFILKFG